MKKFITILLIVSSFNGFTQDFKKLHAGINRERTNNLNPKLSADGKRMIFTTDLDDPRKEFNFFSSKYAGNERWTAPIQLSNVLNLGKVNTFGGYFISYDGEQLIFTSRRHPGVGGYDIWIAQRKGDDWSDPTNLGKPFNSEGHEGDPSLSPDGNLIYFCKCETMSNSAASGCKIVVSEKKGNGFSVPTDLPANINTGNSMSPLILADGQTLIFASDKMGGKGGLDLFLTRKVNGKWSNPVALDYINTPEDERYITIPAKGDIAYYSKKEDEYNVMVKAKIPTELQQNDLVWIMGKVELRDGYSPAAQVVNLTSRETTIWPIDKTGEYSIFLPKGAKYDLSIRDANGKFWFTSDYYDLTSLNESKREKQDVSAESINTGVTKTLSTIMFTSNFELTPQGEEVMDRLTHVLQKNSSWNLQVSTVFDTYKEDSVKSSADLTEIIRDTTIKINVKQDTIGEDSIITVSDTMQVIKLTYHNDKSANLKKAVESYLQSIKIPSNRYKVITKVVAIKEEVDNNRPGFVEVGFK